MRKISEINDRIAARITNGVATMWCAYVFAALAIYGFPYHDLIPTAIIQWVSQEFFQLVLLSIIMVGQRVQAEKIGEVHETVKTHHSLLKKHLGGGSG